MSGIFGSRQQMPTPKPPAPMPDQASPEVLEAGRRESERIMSRAGRRSTILTSANNRGGASFDNYGGKTLGAGG